MGLPLRFIDAALDADNVQVELAEGEVVMLIPEGDRGMVTLIDAERNPLKFAPGETPATSQICEAP